MTSFFRPNSNGCCRFSARGISCGLFRIKKSAKPKILLCTLKKHHSILKKKQRNPCQETMIDCQFFATFGVKMAHYVDWPSDQYFLYFQKHFRALISSHISICKVAKFLSFPLSAAQSWSNQISQFCARQNFMWWPFSNLLVLNTMY